VAARVEVDVDGVTDSGGDGVGIECEAILSGIDIESCCVCQRCKSTEGKQSGAAHVGGEG